MYGVRRELGGGSPAVIFVVAGLYNLGHVGCIIAPRAAAVDADMFTQ